MVLASLRAAKLRESVGCGFDGNRITIDRSARFATYQFAPSSE